MDNYRKVCFTIGRGFTIHAIGRVSNNGKECIVTQEREWDDHDYCKNIFRSSGYKHICVYVCMCVCVCVCVCVSMSICVCLCVYMCVLSGLAAGSVG